MSYKYELSLSGDVKKRLERYSRKYQVPMDEAVRMALGLLFVSENIRERGLEMGVQDKSGNFQPVKGLPVVPEVR